MTRAQSASQGGNHPDELGADRGEMPKPGGEGKANPRVDPKPAKTRLRIVLLVAALLIGAGASACYLRFIAPFASTDDAFIEGHVTPIAPQVPGRVVRVCIQDNQEVSRATVLLEIDARDYEARLAEARANLAAAKSLLEQANAQLSVDQARVGQEKASVTAAEAEAVRAQADLKRYQAVESRAVSRSQIDLAETQAQAAMAQVEVARNRLLGAEAQVGLSKASIQTAAAQVQQREAAIVQAELNLSYTRVTAPEGGRVTRRAVEQGAYVQPGQALMAVVPRPYWIVANFKETQLTHMRAGQPVEIKVDAYPGRRFQGHVESIQAGSGARFSLFPPENATGNYIKVVQRVPVKIVFDDSPDAQLALGPGMSVVPKVRVKQ
jgi:membrane fusion protein (multidrug efflux system)